jgi:predicted alpha/beta hydrolase family esterase
MCMVSGGNILLLHSDNDPFIPLVEAQHVAEQLGAPCQLRVEPSRSHFFQPCEAIVTAVMDVAQRLDAT